MINYDALIAELPKPKLILCNPNSEGMYVLKEAYDINFKIVMGNINELTFKLPYFIDKKHKLVKNNHVDFIKYKFVVKYIRGNYSENLMISTPGDNSDENTDYKSVTCKSLAYQLTDKLIRNYNKEAINTEEVMTDALSESSWGIGTIDPDLINEYRTYESSSTTVLDFLLQVAEKLNAILDFDTNNKLVSIYKKENVGLYQGLRFNYGKYLRTISKEDFTEDMCSRLKPYGANNITIHGLTPHGQNYIEDFTYYMLPFEMDDNGNVIAHSAYKMSDSLCIAILNYQALIESRTGVFQDLLSQLQSQQELLTLKNNELLNINNLLIMAEDELRMLNVYGWDNSGKIAEINDLTMQKNNKLAEIDDINNTIDYINNQINNLRIELLSENNYTPAQLKELDNYVRQREYVNDSIDTEEDLLKAAQEEFENIKVPKIEIKIDIVNFLECIDEYKNWNKLNVGDIVIIYHKTLKINIKAQIIEINFDHENGNINLTISNVKEKNDPKRRFAKKIGEAINTYTQVQQEKQIYRQAATNATQAVSVLNSDTFSAMDRKIVAGYQESTVIDRQGITIKNPENELEQLILDYGLLGLSVDGGKNFKTAITAEKIVADLIQGNLFVGQKLIISGKLADGTTTSVTVDANGVSLNGNALTITGGENGVSLDSSQGLTITRSDNAVKLSLNATSGISIKKNIGTFNDPVWIDNFWVDLNGTLHSTGLQIKEGSFETYDSNGNLITDLKSNTMGFSTLNVGELISPSVVARSNSTYNAYVNPLTGSDSNSGGIDSPRRTIQSVINGIKKHNDGDINIFVVDNGIPVEFYEELSILGINGYGSITIDFQTPNNLLYGSFTINGCNHNINIKNMNISHVEDGYATFWVHNTRRVIADNCKIFSNSKADYSVIAVNSYCDISNSEVRDSNISAIASLTSFVNVIDVTGNSEQYGLYASYAGIIGGNGTSPTGNISDTYVSSGGIYQATHVPTPGLSPIPAPPSLIKKVWTSVDSDTWEMNVGWLNTTDIMQGTKPGKQNYYVGSYFFGDTLTNTLNGKTIVNIRLYLKRKSYGGDSSNSYVTIHPNFHDVKPVDIPQFTIASTSTLFDWGEEKWVDIPTSFYDGFSNGINKGFCVVNTNGSYYNVMDRVAKVEVLYY